MVFFVRFPEAADKTAEQLDGLTVGGEKDGAKGEGIRSARIIRTCQIRLTFDSCVDPVCGSHRSFMPRVCAVVSYLI